MVLTRRGQKKVEELPPSVEVTFEAVKKMIAIAPGMSSDVLDKALKYAFSKELKKAYGSTAYEVIGVELEREGEGKELVPLDVLAKIPAVASPYDDQPVQVTLVLSPDKPKKEEKKSLLIQLALVLLGCVSLFLVRSLLLRPFLRVLYRTGPSYNLGLGTIGFWEGAALSQICATLTGAQDSAFWERNRKQCIAIFAQKEEGEAGHARACASAFSTCLRRARAHAPLRRPPPPPAPLPSAHLCTCPLAAAFLIAVEALLLFAAYYQYSAEIKRAIMATPGWAMTQANALAGMAASGATKTTTAHVDKLAKQLNERDLLKDVKKALGGADSAKYALGLLALVILALFVFYGPLSPF
jgi:hypothetical protein